MAATESTKAKAKARPAKVIKIFTSPTCGFCHMLKEYLSEHKIEHEEVDVSSDEAALAEMVEKSGQSGVPVTMIWAEEAKKGSEEGKPLLIIGFDKIKLDRVLGIED